MKILTSASRIVFILLALTLSFALFFNKIDSKDFIVLCSMAFTYYFTKQPTPDSSVTTTQKIEKKDSETI